MGEEDEVSEETEAVGEDFGVTATLRGVVVEEDDEIAGDHGAGAPGKNGEGLKEGGDVEETHAVEQGGHVASGDEDGFAVDENVGDLASVSRDGGARGERDIALKAILKGVDATQMMRVELADKVESARELGVEQGGFDGVEGEDGAGGLEGVIEADSIDALEIAELVLLGPMGAKELGIFLEDGVTARVKAQVDGLARGNGFDELSVFVLEVLPSRGDHGDLTRLDTMGGEGVLDGDVESLRT